MSPEQIEIAKKEIDNMTHYQMVSLWRFAKVGHPYFRCDLPLYAYFKERFDKLGGMTSEISKQLGW
jgi:hypothetical protein